MAIDDNANYTLTGAQVKDLASKVKASDPLIIYTSAAIGNAFQTYSDDNLTVVITGAQIGAAFKAGRQIILTTDTILEPTATIIAFTDGPEDMFTCVVDNTTYRYGYKSAQSRWVAVSRTVNDGTLTIQHNGTDVQTFTANQSTNVTANIETIYADTIAPATPVAPVTADMIDFSTMYVSAPTPSADVSIGTGAIVQTITLPAGKWRVFSSFRLSCGGMTANQTKFFYCGFKNGTTTSSTNILQIPTNMTADVTGSGRSVVTMICKEITATSSYVVSSYVQSGDLPTSDLKIYRDPGIQLFAMRVG